LAPSNKFIDSRSVEDAELLEPQIQALVHRAEMVQHSRVEVDDARAAGEGVAAYSVASGARVCSECVASLNS